MVKKEKVKPAMVKSKTNAVNTRTVEKDIESGVKMIDQVILSPKNAYMHIHSLVLGNKNTTALQMIEEAVANPCNNLHYDTEENTFKYLNCEESQSQNLQSTFVDTVLGMPTLIHPFTFLQDNAPSGLEQAYIFNTRNHVTSHIESVVVFKFITDLRVIWFRYYNAIIGNIADNYGEQISADTLSMLKSLAPNPANLNIYNITQLLPRFAVFANRIPPQGEYDTINISETAEVVLAAKHITVKFSEALFDALYQSLILDTFPEVFENITVDVVPFIAAIQADTVKVLNSICSDLYKMHYPELYYIKDEQ